MFVITADQVDSRTDIDRAQALIRDLDPFAGSLLLPIDQTAGDEVQMITADPVACLDIILRIARDGHWSIGLGVGSVRTPLPDAVRKAAGSAFVAARQAVEAAKRSDARFALRATTTSDAIGVDDVEPFLRLLLLVRSRRTEPGWEVVDLMAMGRTQKEVAGILGISGAAVSMRLKNALWHVDEDARPAIARLLDHLDAEASPHNEGTA